MTWLENEFEIETESKQNSKMEIRPHNLLKRMGLQKKKAILPGLEPGIPRLVVRSLIHWATCM